MSTDATAMTRDTNAPPARKFLFERSFDDELAMGEQAPPVFSLEQLEAAKQEAFDNGQKAGKKAMIEDQQQHMNALLSQVDKKLDHLLETGGKQWEKQLAHLQEVGLTIARKIMPAYAERHGLEEIETIISQVVAEMGREPRLVVRVAESQFDAVSAKINEISAQRAYAGKVIVLSEPELGPADCRVEWADGGIDRDIKTLWQEIDRIMEHAQSLAPPPSSQPPSESSPPSTPLPPPSQPSDASGE